MSTPPTSDAPHDVYLVTEHLHCVAPVETNSLELELKLTMPGNYREYLQTLGVGEYCDILMVHPPDRIRKDRNLLREIIAYGDFWDVSGVGLSREELGAGTIFASTSNGDYFVLHPRLPNRVLALPEGDSKVPVCSSDGLRLERLCWDLLQMDAPIFSYFEAFVQRCQFETSFQGSLKLPEFQDWLINEFGGAGHRILQVPIEHNIYTRIYLRNLQGFAYVVSNAAGEIQRCVSRIDSELTASAHLIKQFLSVRGFGIWSS